jgi:hypothetical protein
VKIYSVSVTVTILLNMYITTAEAQPILGCPGQVFTGVEDNGKVQVTLNQLNSTYTSTSIGKTARLASFYCVGGVFYASLVNASDTNNCSYAGAITNGTIQSGTQSCLNGTFNFSGNFQ